MSHLAYEVSFPLELLLDVGDLRCGDACNRSLSSSRMQSLLARVSAADIVEEPFPHVVFHEPLESELCDRLIAEFPSLDVMSKGRAYKSNERLDHHAYRAVQNARLSPLWRDFVVTHVSQGFLNQQLGLFDESIRRRYPSVAETIGLPALPRAGMRYVDTFETADVLLEAQAAVNTPVTVEPSAVRGAHLDKPNKLIVGLYYLRHPDDDSGGGDLELYRYRTAHPEFDGHEVPGRFVELVKTIPYERNVLVLFLNTPHSLHGVSVREQTPCVRMFLNLGSEVEADLFTIPSREARLPVVTSEIVRRRTSRRGRRHAPLARRPLRRQHSARDFVRKQARFLVLPLAGIATFTTTALLVEAFTDRDWSLSGLEWPADFLTAVLLVCLVPLALGLLRLLRRTGNGHSRSARESE
jgi:hypothetical protein